MKMSLKKVTKNGKTKENSKVAGKRALDGKEVINVVDFDDKVRELVVPSLEPTVYPALLDIDEFKRLKRQAKVVTAQERLNLLEEEDRKKNELIQQCLARKDDMRKWSQIQSKDQKYSILESDARRRATHLLRRAFEMKQEQEDEVKRANGLILSTKCHAIRNAQIAEKKQIEKDLEEEERRLDQMMEDDRRRALLDEEEREEKEKLKRDLYVRQVKEQIKENEIERILDLERKEEESRLINEVQMQVQLEELEACNKKLAQQAQMREELNAINKQIEKFHDLEIEEDRISEMRIQEFMRQKAEREEAREKELALQHMAKEKEIARLRALQQRQQDLQILEVYRSDIMKQINEKERERINERQKIFEEGVALRTEQKDRERHMNNVLEKKIRGLRAQQIPEIYVKEIERKLKLSE
ncbi:hypothetical protein C0J52_02150 [Blattella germanica]|nr:hypothetical protein C0J52_02150 [Blattella germanica]